ncbi:hypothetical protein CC1G_06406 [Coprinopsis cinerea okayama7|uniref:Uncharacterized protein n=1 Tax=Coprinopsis cinerea (strain Okayama-7 / 130 / ATCC MYA-4618 / FGSC 9003) TaxID=240176 RepID=A8NTW8_COPC7|nr:hypothetical protein CC1G_06406 [Coprinopsis cinerea okayama7\|eukprot:XP_001836321.1 hypothetical protein CC1G_06406 [Coprinopsis cinerea okayama7\
MATHTRRSATKTAAANTAPLGASNKENAKASKASSGKKSKKKGSDDNNNGDEVLLNVMKRMEQFEALLTAAQKENDTLRARLGTDTEPAPREGCANPDENAAGPKDGDMARGGGGDEASVTGGGDGGDNEDVDIAVFKDKIAELEKQLAAKNAIIETTTATANATGPPPKPTVPDGSILRPRGNFSIQVAMGLAGSEKKHSIYQALVRAIKHISGQSPLQYHLTWAENSNEDKVRVFRKCREAHPFLRRFHNDWATEAIRKQWFKNRGGNAYANGYLEVPPKYAYVKDNAAKRNPNGSRVKKSKIVLAKKKNEKRARLAKSKHRTAATSTARADAEEEAEDGMSVDESSGDEGSGEE